MKERNNKQDVSIARLEEKFKAFEKRFDNFVGNHFESFKKEIKAEVRAVKEETKANRKLIITSILIPIFLFIISQWIK